MDDKRKKCFVIQEFDGSTFDRRYEESFAPAVKEADVDPVRADKILGLKPIITKIEENIGKTDICLCDVSTDNPNVWLELGYALAMNRPAVIICDLLKREKLPFDIQHRPVIFYRSDSKSGFVNLEEKITEAILNELSQGVKTNKFSITISESGQRELDEFEIEIIGFLVSKWDGDDGGGASKWQIDQHMSKVGFNELSVGLGLSSLHKRELIKKVQIEDYDGGGNQFFVDGYSLTSLGIEWVENNRNLFTTKVSKAGRKQVKTPLSVEDDLPF